MEFGECFELVVKRMVLSVCVCCDWFAVIEVYQCIEFCLHGRDTCVRCWRRAFMTADLERATPS